MERISTSPFIQKMAVKVRYASRCNFPKQPANCSSEYDDDTTIIPRSTTVVARRLPPQKPGAGRAARYVSGKMPASAKNSSRREAVAKPAKPVTTGLTHMSAAMTEEEKMLAMFEAQSDQWVAQQEEMSQYVFSILLFLGIYMLTIYLVKLPCTNLGRKSPRTFQTMIHLTDISVIAVGKKVIGFRSVPRTTTLTSTTGLVSSVRRVSLAHS
jgi:hypothetical protein